MASYYTNNWQDRGALPLDMGNDEKPKQEQQKPQGKKRGFALSLLPMATSTIGGVLGGLAGGVGGFFGGAGVGAIPGAAVGTAGGGAAGGALGEWLAQKISGEADDGIDKGNLVEEGAWGALPALGKVAKGAKATVMGAKASKIASKADDAAKLSNITKVRPGNSAQTSIETLMNAGNVDEAAKVAGKIKDPSLRAGMEAVTNPGATKVVVDPVTKKISRVPIEAAETATKGGIKDRISNFLFREADNTSLRASQLSGKKEALKGFEGRFGEDLGTYLRKNKLIGKTGKDVEETVIKSLNDDYGKLVSKINRPITSSDVLAQNQKQLEKLLQSSSTDKKKLGQQVFDELQQIFAKGDAIDPADFNRVKAEYQTLARSGYKLGADPSRTGVNKEIAGLLKRTLQGVSGSDDLARTGKELDKAFKASDLLSSAAQNGRGTLGFGLTDSIMAGGGFAGAGIPGAAAAVAGKRAFNSPKVQSFIANKLASAGEKIATGGAKTVVDAGKQSVGKMIKSQLPVRGVQSIVAMNGAAQPPAGAAQEFDLESLMSGQDQGGGLSDEEASARDQANLQALINGGESESQYSKENMMADIQRDPDNMAKYASLYELMNPEGEKEETLSLSDGAITKITDAQKALAGLDELDAIVNGDFAGGVVEGRIRGKNPFDNTYKSQQASIDRIRQIVGKALEGGVLRKEDEEKYKKILPTMTDSADVARSKIAQLRNMMQQDMQKYTATQQVYGKGAGQTSAYDIQSIMGGGSTY